MATHDSAAPGSQRGRGRHRWWRRLRSLWHRPALPLIGPDEAYRIWAADYGRPLNRFQSLEQESLLRLLPELDRRVVLDLGCGSGRIGRLALAGGAERVYGVDSTLPMLARAVAEPAPGAAWAAAKAPHLPFPDQVFDLVACALMLGHVRDLGPALGEISRVLRPLGVVLISDFHPSASQRGWRRTVTDPTTGRECAITHHVHTLAAYHRQLAGLGFDVEALDEPQHDGLPVAFVLRARKPPAGGASGR